MPLSPIPAHFFSGLSLDLAFFTLIYPWTIPLFLPMRFGQDDGICPFPFFFALCYYGWVAQLVSDLWTSLRPKEGGRGREQRAESLSLLRSKQSCVCG